MNNANYRILYRLLFSYLVCFQALTAFSAAVVNMTVTFHNVGTNSWNDGAHVIEQFVNPGSPYAEVENLIGMDYYTDAEIPPGGSHTVSYPNDSEPIYGPSYGPSLATAVYWCENGGGPTWPSQTPVKGLFSSWSGNPPDILTCSFTVDVNTNCFGYVPCMSNVAFTVKNNTFQNQWFYQAQAPGAGQAVGGVLMLPAGGSGYSVASWPCKSNNATLYTSQTAPGSTGGGADGLGTGISPDDGVPVSGAVPSYGAGVGSGGGGVSPGAGGSPPTTSYSPPSPLNYNATNANNISSNSPIYFDSSAGIMGVVEQGFSALDALGQQGITMAHNDSTALAGRLAGAGGSTNGNSAGVSNVWVQNFGAVTNALNSGLSQLGSQITNGLNGLTNLLTYGQLTNGLAAMGETNGLTFGQFTNGLALMGGTNSQFTNGLTFAQLTNFAPGADLTNSFLGELFASTNGATALGGVALPGGVLGFGHDSSVLDDAAGGGGVSPVIQVGGSGGKISFMFGSVAGMPSFPGARGFMKWIVIVTLFMLVWRSFMGNIRRMFFVTANSVDLGLLNTVAAGAGAALVACSAIMATIVAFIALVLPSVTGFADQVVASGGTSPMAAMAATWAWQFLTEYAPIPYIVSSVVAWIGFQLFSDSAAVVALGVIKFLSVG